ncbi:MAG TPA: ion channel [Gemmatimonadaceae bacterium]|nr:ion channel [Gemmatimonadaceae bacterium]
MTMPGQGAQVPNAEEPKDLGFGTVVGAQHSKRLLNRDGSFNVERQGLPRFGSLSLYHDMLSMSWPKFLALLVCAYMATNFLFAWLYVLCGPNALAGVHPSDVEGRFAQAFFFSVHTLATIGYGNVTPVSLAANFVVTIESISGLLGFALATGVLFSRFARPTARVIFSNRAVVAPYRGGSGFMFRIINGRSNQLIELEVKVLFTRIEQKGGATVRRYDQLTLERTRVVFFPLSWTIVHPIDEKSPLSGLTARDLQECEAEFLVMLSGIDETFSQQVHARSSYKADEVRFGERFVSMYNPLAADGSESVDVSRLHETELAPLDGAGLMTETSTWRHTGHFTGFVPPRK